MRDTDVKAVILECHRQIEMMCKATCSSESPYELCLELDMEKRTVGYYCVRHDIDDPYVFWWQPVLSQIFDQDIKHFQGELRKDEHRRLFLWV